MAKNRKGLAMHDHRGWSDDFSGYHGQGYEHIVHTAKKGWNTGDAPKVCENCDWLPRDNKQRIMVNHEVWKSLMGICSKVKLEWQALLTGTIEDGVVHVTGYWIPKQEVSQASVKNLDLVDDVVIATRGIVAGVHSHGNMACFFSQTDVDDTNMSLIKHNIVINNQNQYKAQSRIELPCGLVKFVDAEVFTVGEPVTDLVGLENITERTYGFETKSPTIIVERKYDTLKNALRWCPICLSKPEEDSGELCTCWTKGLRHMLPDFTDENYEVKNGRVYELKPWLQQKFGGDC